MSIAAVAWAMGQPIRPSAAKFLLVVIGDQVSDEDGLACPDVDRLCEVACQDRGEVLAHIDALVRDGYLIGMGERRGVYRMAYWSPPTYRAQARKKAVISASLRTRVFERDGYHCRHCDAHHDLTADHVVPESKGGPTTLDNLQTLCRSCNSKKGVSMPAGAGE